MPFDHPERDRSNQAISNRTKDFAKRPTPVFLALVVIVLGILSATGCSDRRRANRKFTTVVIGVDGLRWDYPEEFGLSAIRDVGERGVRAGSMIPVFPTKTFANFYSLATGLFPNRSGILGNTMYDPVLDVQFRLGDTTSTRDGRWFQGEPMWVTVEKQGSKAAVFFWAGSEAEISGYRPSHWRSYDQSVSNEVRIEQVLNWLRLPRSERPDLIMVYFEALDEAAHRFGPISEETIGAALSIDGHIRKLVRDLETIGLQDSVNVVIVSDHGMAPVSEERVIFADDYVDTESAGFLTYGQHVTIWPQPDAVDSVYWALAGAHPELKVYNRDNLPRRFHLEGHQRTAPIIAVPSTGWTVSTHASAERWPRQFSGGAHGYDNRDPNMHAVFAAAGPAFRRGVHVDSLRSVDVYNLVIASLDLEPAPNDGDESLVPQVMTDR